VGRLTGPTFVAAIARCSPIGVNRLLHMMQLAGRDAVEVSRSLIRRDLTTRRGASHQRSPNLPGVLRQAIKVSYSTEKRTAGPVSSGIGAASTPTSPNCRSRLASYGATDYQFPLFFEVTAGVRVSMPCGKPWIELQSGISKKLDLEQSSAFIWNDLIVFTLHDKRCYIDAFQVLSEVRFRERLDTIVMGQWALAPPIMPWRHQILNKPSSGLSPGRLNPLGGED
jgi:hypothetical protein